MVCPLDAIFTWGSWRMFLYHCELVPVTGSSNTFVPLSTNQTGRGMSFLLFLPVTVSSISFSFVKLDFRLPAFMLAHRLTRFRVRKRFHQNPESSIFEIGAEKLRLSPPASSQT